jgi:Tfp pilus assembly protein PilV
MRKNSGFTFIEAMACMVLISVGIVGYMVLYAQVGGRAALSDRVVLANALAREQLESILSYKAANGYSAVVNDNFPDRTYTDPAGKDKTVYTIQTTILRLASDLSLSLLDLGYKQVDVSVTWSSTESGVTLTTLVTSY